jgi:outer membrane protein assembly factor BamB
MRPNHLFIDTTYINIQERKIMKITNTLFKTTLISTALLLGQANAAAPFDPEAQPLGYIGPLELNGTNLSLGGARAYRGWFENGACQPSPQQSGGAENWSAHVQFAAQAADYWDVDRKIITSTNGTNQVAFRWANLTAAQKQLIDGSAFAANAASSDIVDFLRGDRSNEKPAGALRLRYTVLGDIIHGNPEYLAEPRETFSDSTFVAYKNANLNRAERVYVGANDGKLHAFNANNGNEVWAYVPSMVMHKLSRLAGTPYSHTYFVDGAINIRSAYYSGAWHSVLVGAMGAGAKGLYALDVTSPAMSSENLATGINKKILWELSADSDDDLGYIFDRTRIVKMNDGKWYAVNGNGVSSVNGVAKLYLVDIGSGNVIKVSTGAGSKASPNGLATPALVDTDGDGKVDIAFAGDIDGDMWKFDLTSTNSGGWKLDYKLYDGKASQPIALAPDITRHPQYGYMVLFGTGRLYTDADIKDKSVQSLYGIWDTGSTPTGAEKRLDRLLSVDTDFTAGIFSEVVRTFTTTDDIDFSVYRGWKVDLPAGERLLTPPLLRAGRLKSTITNPDGYKNWLLEVVFDEGSAEEDTIFDLDRNAKLDTADRVDGNADGDLLDRKDIPMGWKRNDGAMSQVTIARLGAGYDTLFLNFLNPPLVPPSCTGSCGGGLTGGHMDVDTDSGSNNGLGGKTNGHVHEYDDKFNLTYVDYYDLQGGKLTNVDDVGIAGNEEFIVLIANADWSPGAVLTINDKSYSVVEYQRIIHKALAKWNGAGPLKDPDGDSLIHTLDSLAATKAANPKAVLLRNTFDNLAIISGGLIGTQTGCVNKSENITNGRWRNGALIFHLVKRSLFNGLGGASALDRLTVQTPTDLKKVVVLSDGTQVELTEDLDKNGVIDGTSPNYEIYGGLTAKNNSEFLFESTLFWHFGEVADEFLGVKPCYGDPEWEEAFKLETQGVSPEVYDDLLADAGYSSFAELEDYVDSLQDCKDIKEKNGGCQKAYQAVEALYNMGLLVENTKNGGNGNGNGDGTGTGNGVERDPLVMGGGSELSGGGLTCVGPDCECKDGKCIIISGPNAELGRRTWIDIMPE